jgi:hypothetical protein
LRSREFYTPLRLVQSLLVGLALLAFRLEVAAPQRLAAQSTTIELRPTTYQSGASLGNPQNAYDNSDSTTSGASLGRVCRQTCTTPTSASATWLGIPDGYHPIRLEIHWQLFATTALYGGDTSLVSGKAAYSLDSGGSWSTLEEFSWTGQSPSCSNHGITCADHVATLSLSDLQHTSAIQVRASLTVQLTHCDNCYLRVSNNGGSIWVYDVRVVADNCQIPVAESSTSSGWQTAYPLRTAHDFLQTLTPAGANSFSGRTVIEADGGDTVDGCHYTGSGVPDEVTEIISGGTWTVAANNTWTPDTIGWGEDAVNFYQASSRTKPCNATGSQIMFMSCGSTYVPYTKNALMYGIDTGSVSAQRQSTAVSKSWP